MNGKVKKRTIANLSDCSPEEIAAIKLALKYRDDLTALGSLKESVELQEGLSVGAVWTVYQVALEVKAQGRILRLEQEFDLSVEEEEYPRLKLTTEGQQVLQEGVRSKA